ncbi:MAG: tetratricopeptide repeat protein [Actinomycetota bacterium]
MTLTRDRLPFKLAAALLAFAAVFFSLRALDDSGTGLPLAAAAPTAIAPDATTDERIAALRAQIDQTPSDPEGYVSLGGAYLTKVGETADSGYYQDAEDAFRQALRVDPDNFDATTEMGKLALARHDFRGGLRYGERARQINPSIASNYGVLTDANVELGRYAQAERTLQTWVNLKPGLAPYARVSYFRELHGDLPGALAAMKLAASAGSSSKDFSYVQTLVGKLHFDSGRYAAAERAYRSAQGATAGGYPGALAGLGAVEAARGNYAAALGHYRAAEQALPVADYPLAIGEIRELQGRQAAAGRSYARTEVLIRREIPNGVDVRAELALFRAEHGDPDRAVALARATLPVRPSVTTADSLAWSLHKAGNQPAALRWSQQAMRLGSRDPHYLYRAGMISLAAGDGDRAERLLSTLESQSPRFNPLYAPQAREALAQLR